MKQNLYRYAIPIAFTLSICYWIYLFFTSRMIVIFDSITYEGLGRVLYEGHWTEWFKTGPHREPFYPFIIACAMRMADLVGSSYHEALKFIQLSILLGTQVLSLKILKTFKISKPLIAGTILYLGFSPALVNSALSVYSEVATYPFILGIVILSAMAWRSLHLKDPFRAIGLALLTSLLFMGAILTKGIYAYVLMIYLLSFSIPLIRALLKKKKNMLINTVYFVLIVFLFCQGAVHAYKSLYKKYAGMYALTDSRGALSLYASAARRTEPLTARRLMAGVAHTGGEGLCNFLMGEEECYFWGAQHYDSYGHRKLSELSRTLPKQEVQPAMTKLAGKKAMERPVQFAFLMGLECVKMFFWESTKIGYVTYPHWLSRLYDFTPFKNTLRLLLSVLSLLGFYHLSVNILFKERRHLCSGAIDYEFLPVAFFIFIIIVSHTGLYALFMTVPRFALPIAPLELITIASFFHYLNLRSKKS